MTTAVGLPGIFLAEIAPPPPSTYDSVLMYFDGKRVSAVTRAEAWSWWRMLQYQDQMEDQQTIEREGAKVALTAVITQCALLQLS